MSRSIMQETRRVRRAHGKGKRANSPLLDPESPAAPPPPAGLDNLFDWDKSDTAADVTQAEWNAYITDLTNTYGNVYPTSAPTRPAGNNAKKVTITGTTHRMWALHNNNVATMAADGTLVHEVRDLSNVSDDQTLIWLDGDGDAWESTGYLSALRQYEFTLKFQIKDTTTPLADYKDNSKMPFWVLFELWRNASGNLAQMPIQFIVDQLGGTGDNVFLLRLRGSTAETPTSYSRDDEWQLAVLDLVEHTFHLKIRWDYTGSTAYAKAYWDDVLIVDDSGNSIGTNIVGGNELESLAPFFGEYHSDSQAVGPLLETSEFRIDEGEAA